MRGRWALVALLWACDGGGGAPTVDAAACGPELCNEVDDDCDGRVDEGFDLSADPAHCGLCWISCALPEAEAICVEGRCGIGACSPGRRDLDGDPDNGCEAACTATGAEFCNEADDDCDGQVDEDFDLAVNREHCGGCGRACVYPHGDGRCEDGACSLGRCQPGYADEDGEPENGCEAPCVPVAPGPEICDGEDNDCDGLADEGYDLSADGEHCGRCGRRCAFAHAAGRCRDGGCVIAGCEAGFVDADGRLENGCEARCAVSEGGIEICDERDNDCDGGLDEGIDKEADPLNCGGCGRLDSSHVCARPNAAVACVEGQCRLDHCHPGFADADGVEDNGCETPCVARGDEICDGVDDDCDGRVDEGFDLTADLDHCGACDRPCETGDAEPACVAGRCAIAACPPGFVDADLDPRTGCEYACVPTADPAEVCDGVDNDCDGGLDEGFDLLGDVAHCGGCGQACAPPNALPVCALGRCDLVGCAEGWFDANADPEDGCEVACAPAADLLERCNGADDDCDERVDEGFDLGRDPLHCGACGRRCLYPNGVLRCVEAACVVDGCLPGWHDLNGEAEDGCEYRCDPAGVERCDGSDEDCDGVVDEGFDLRHDAAHCGGCGVDCAAPHADTECQDGICAVVACAAGFRDVNGLAFDGCEAECRPSADGQERCDGVDEDCDGRVDEGFDLANDPLHCGVCGRRCQAPQGEAFCNAGRCAILRCDAGFADADADPATGCECRIQNGGVEACNGVDDDCNGVVDDADQLVPPLAIRCLSRGVCAGVRPACRDAEWRCPYPLTYEDEERTCDTRDNDCDGRTDEGFPDLGRPCSAGVGVCGEEGVVACAGPAATACAARAHPEAAAPEVCNERDDDCDGRVDEGADRLVALPAGAGVPAFSIYAYEASRPDATAEDPGRGLARACSAPGRLPWAGVGRATAEAACGAAGLRLCTAAQWARACGAATYPYGEQYDPEACNGQDFDVDPLEPGDQDGALPTGALPRCRRAGVFDLSGNLWEWTRGPAEPGALRGGSFGNIAPGLTCGFELASPVGAARENVGFRCCTP